MNVISMVAIHHDCFLLLLVLILLHLVFLPFLLAFLTLLAEPAVGLEVLYHQPLTFFQNLSIFL